MTPYGDPHGTGILGGMKPEAASKLTTQGDGQ